MDTEHVVEIDGVDETSALPEIEGACDETSTSIEDTVTEEIVTREIGQVKWYNDK